MIARNQREREKASSMNMFSREKARLEESSLPQFQMGSRYFQRPALLNKVSAIRSVRLRTSFYLLSLD